MKKPENPMELDSAALEQVHGSGPYRELLQTFMEGARDGAADYWITKTETVTAPDGTLA